MNILQKTAKQLFRSIQSLSIMGKLFIALCALLILVFIYNKHHLTQEGFQQSQKFVLKQGSDVFDPFYVDYYDDLTYDPYKNNFELKEILQTTKIKPTKATILDVGCGTGHHCKLFEKQGAKVYGLDKSDAMIKRCNKLHKNIDFRVGDATQSITFPPNSFDLINCLYFTIYYVKDKQQFLQNCFEWLKPQGYLALHLVNKDKFNPILNVADPLVMVSPQKYAKERITNSVVKFNDFQYKADFQYKKGNENAKFVETFKNDTNSNVRKNEHVFYMPSQKSILSMAKSAGFIMKGYIDMVACQYEYQYIYLLYKP
jgi:SAM-dependent methyltransferase